MCLIWGLGWLRRLIGDEVCLHGLGYWHGICTGYNMNDIQHCWSLAEFGLGGDIHTPLSLNFGVLLGGIDHKSILWLIET